jgi:hypothetical protein
VNTVTDSGDFCDGYNNSPEETQASYYVSTSGSDSNDGSSISSPWKTLAYPATQLTEGIVYSLKRDFTKEICIACGIQ